MNENSTLPDDVRRIAALVGSDEVIEVWDEPDFSPAALVALSHRVSHRLRSSGGRPTDPSWELTRQVPFSGLTWSRLKRLSEQLSARGRRVAPAQVAAMLVEDGVGELMQLDQHIDATRHRWDRAQEAKSKDQ